MVFKMKTNGDKQSKEENKKQESIQSITTSFFSSFFDLCSVCLKTVGKSKINTGQHYYSNNCISKLYQLKCKYLSVL